MWLLPLPHTGLTQPQPVPVALTSPTVPYPVLQLRPIYGPSPHNLPMLCPKQTLHRERLLNQSESLMSVLRYQSPEHAPVQSMTLMLRQKPLTTETAATVTLRRLTETPADSGPGGVPVVYMFLV